MKTEQGQVPQVYPAIVAVMQDLSAEGIGKTRRNTQQGYQFRGVDDVYNTLAPVLAKHKLIILPRVLGRDCQERESKQGGRIAYVTVDMEFDLVSGEDGSKHTIRTSGEAMDSADKATNKAMSAAYKYAAFQAFCIPTEGDNDADAHTHEVSAPLHVVNGNGNGTADVHGQFAASWLKKICEGDKASYDEIRNRAKSRGIDLVSFCLDANEEGCSTPEEILTYMDSKSQVKN